MKPFGSAGPIIFNGFRIDGHKKPGGGSSWRFWRSRCVGIIGGVVDDYSRLFSCVEKQLYNPVINATWLYNAPYICLVLYDVNRNRVNRKPWKWSTSEVSWPLWSSTCWSSSWAYGRPRRKAMGRNRKRKWCWPAATSASSWASLPWRVLILKFYIFFSISL